MKVRIIYPSDQLIVMIKLIDVSMVNITFIELMAAKNAPTDLFGGKYYLIDQLVVKKSDALEPNGS